MTVENIKHLKARANQMAISCSNDEIRNIIANEDEGLIVFIPISLAFYRKDHTFIEEICIKLAEHSNEYIRGNAVLAFGHLASRFEGGVDDRVYEIVKKAMKDKSEYVRGQAISASDDLEDFLGWDFNAN